MILNLSKTGHGFRRRSRRSSGRYLWHALLRLGRIQITPNFVSRVRYEVENMFVKITFDQFKKQIEH